MHIPLFYDFRMLLDAPETKRAVFGISLHISDMKFHILPVPNKFFGFLKKKFLSKTFCIEKIENKNLFGTVGYMDTTVLNKFFTSATEIFVFQDFGCNILLRK